MQNRCVPVSTNRPKRQYSPLNAGTIQARRPEGLRCISRESKALTQVLIEDSIDEGTKEVNPSSIQSPKRD